MIESNIVKWVDLGDNIQSLDIYGRTRWVSFFNLIRIMLNFKKFSIFFYIFLKCLFFLQILMLNLTNVTDTSDSAVQILKYISTVIFIQDIITDQSSYKIAVIVNSVLTLSSILFLVYMIVSIRIGKFYVKFPIILMNIINVVLLNYLIGPIIQISIMATRCVDGIHFYLNVPCYSDYLHIIFIVISLINMLFFAILSIILSIYYNEIGAINETKFLARINTNYEIVTNLSKISIFIFAYFVKFYGSDSENSKIFLQVYLLISTMSFAFFVYKKVLFYDSRVYAVILYGWIFAAWFSIVIFLKTLLIINDTSIFHIVGWLIISCIVYFLEEAKEEYLLTDFNIFDAKSLKDIEMFNLKLFDLLNQRSMKNKTLLVGIIKKFEELMKNNEDLNDKYTKLSSNTHLKIKFNSTTALSILSMVYIFYDHHLDKSILKNDILLTLCYFLINKFKNITYAVYLCSKIKVNSHKEMYLKYLLMEEIKEHLVNRISKSGNKESIKHVQLGSVILHNIYMDLFKEKIFQALSNQIDYFDLLKSTVTTNDTTENFLNIGEEILTLRREILKTWERIIELNPFSEESFRDYLFYLEKVLQDDMMVRQEVKKYSTYKTAKLSLRNNIYHTMFDLNSSVLLVDGYLNFGKILYTSPNFSSLYGFSQTVKELLNMNIDDLVPNVVREFHKEIVENGIRFSNINYIFRTQRDMLLKGKTGSIYNVNIYVKCIPNLTFGLIYMVSIQKKSENNYIVVLDREFKINGLTDIFSNNQGMQISYSLNNYSLERSVISSHFGLIIPDILIQLEYNEKEGYFIRKDETDLKGTLYTVLSNRGLNEKIEKILEKIRLYGKLPMGEDRNHESCLGDYEDLCKDITSKATNRHSVFYRILTSSFLEGKHKYHRVYISNDLITMNENTNANNLDYSSEFGRGRKDRKDRRDGMAKNTKINAYLENLEKVNSQKQIRIKVAHTSGEEENKLLDHERDIDDIKKEKKNQIEDKKESAVGSHSHLSHLTKSALSRSSVDSASFNKLKNGILEKKEVSSITFMRYLCLLFGIGSIILIFFSTEISNENFANQDRYLLQNLYFNHTKIAVSCIYFATLNIKFLKNNIYQNNFCYKPCKELYSSLLSQCIADVKIEKENSTDFYPDFKKILNNQKIIELEIFNLTERNKVTVDVESALNIIITYGLKLNSNIEEYYKLEETTLDTVVENILAQSLLFLEDEAISGFDFTQTEKNLSGPYFSPINITLIIEGTLFIILLSAFTYLIFSLFKLEAFYLKKLIQFKNPSFESYLKDLDDYKKKNSKNESEDVDNLKDDIDGHDFLSKEESKKEEEKEKKKKHKEEKEKKIDKDKEKKADKEKENEKKSVKRKKKVVKNYQDDKVKLMGQYFIYWNLFFFIKVLAIFLFSVSYYLIVFVMGESTNEELLSFNSISNNIEGVYKSSVDIFLQLKKEIKNYAENEIERIQLANYLERHSSSSVFFRDMKFTKKEDLLKANLFYPMNLPKQIETPKIGSLLMTLVNTDLTTASESLVKLNQLYNINTCTVLFSNTTSSEDYKFCATFWSSILLKGMEQSITQMSVVVTTVLDDFHSLDLQKKTLDQVIHPSSSFGGYQLFVEFYLYKSYMQTVEIFRDLNSDILDHIFNVSKIIMIGYICFIVILFAFLLYLVNKSKEIFNTFMNFIGIMPLKFLIDDQVLYKEILKLEQYIYY